MWCNITCRLLALHLMDKPSQEDFQGSSWPHAHNPLVSLDWANCFYWDVTLLVSTKWPPVQITHLFFALYSIGALSELSCSLASMAFSWLCGTITHGQVFFFLRTDRHFYKSTTVRLVEVDNKLEMIVTRVELAGEAGLKVYPGLFSSPPCFWRPHHPVWRAPLEAAAYLWSTWTTLLPAAKLQPSSLCVNSWKRLFWRSPHPSLLPQSSASCPLQQTMSSSTWWDWKKSCRTF